RQDDTGGRGHVAACHRRQVEAGNGVVADVGAHAVDNDALQVSAGCVGEQPGHHVVFDAGIGKDAVGVIPVRPAAGVVDAVAPYQVVVARDLDADGQVVVQAVVLHQVAGAAEQLDTL